MLHRACALLPLALTVLGSAPLAAATAATWYVAPSGSDAQGDGSLANPWQTIARAQAAVQAQAPTMAGDLVVMLRGGSYAIATPLVFTPADGGQNGHQVIYQAYPGERPVLTGGTVISGWTLVDATRNLWQAPVPAGFATRQLYINGVRATRATSGAPLPGTVTQTAAGFVTTDTSLASYQHPEDLELVFTGGPIAHAADCLWTEDRITVTGITTVPGGLQITVDPTEWSLAMAKGEMAPKLPTSYENALELVTTPGSWYLDTHAQLLSYIPRAGESLPSAVVTAPTTEVLLEGNGAPGAPLTNLQFNGLTFAYATWMLPSSQGLVENQAQWTFGYPQVPAAVQLHAAQGVVFQNDVFAHLGAAAIDLDTGPQNDLIQGCVFSDCSGCAIELGDRNAEPASALQTTGVTISNNLITQFGLEYRGSCGISTGYLANCTIAQNEISYGPYTGISLGFGTGTSSYAAQNQVTGNNIHHLMQVLDDGGAVYSFMMPMPGSTISGNYIHDFDTKLYAAGIYPDQESADLLITGNVFAAVPRWLRIWISSVQDITADSNYTTSATYINVGTNCSVTNTTVLGTTWTSQADAIAGAAGLQGSYAAIAQEPLDPASGSTVTATSNPGSASSSGTPAAPAAAPATSSPGGGGGCGIGTGVAALASGLGWLRRRRPGSASKRA